MSPRAAYSPFFRSLRRLQAAFWRRRVVHWLIRAAWLALLVPTLFMAGYLWLDWRAHWSYWLFPMVGIILGSMLWAVRPISLKKIAYRLDKRLGFRAQLITAYKVSQAANDLDNLVVHRLLHEGVNVVVNIRQEVRIFNRTLWLEMQALIGVLVLLGAMLLLDALNPRLPNATLVELPPPLPEPAADEVIPPNPQLFPPPFAPEIQVQALSGEAVQQALEALADALRDLAVTRAAAEAIDRGDLAGAAESLRGLADQLGELSEEARAELGDTLGEAADDVGDGVPGLSEPLQDGSQALGADNLGQAGQALADLAETLEALQETPQETAQAPEESQSGEESQAQAETGNNPAAETEQPQAGETENPPAESGEEGTEPAEQPAEAGDGAGEGDGEGEGEDQPTEAERLALEGQPLELESDSEQLDEQVLQPAELDAEAGDRLTEDSPFGRSSANASTDLGPDPLTYPWDKREIIRRYFTP